MIGKIYDIYLREMKRAQETTQQQIIAENRTLQKPTVEQYHIDKKTYVEENMHYDNTLTHFLLNIGVDIMEIEKLIYTYYLGTPDMYTALLWRMSSRGEPISGNTIVYDEKSGAVVTHHRIFNRLEDRYDNRQDRLFSDHMFGTAFFGGHLLGMEQYRRMPVGVVQDEKNALLCALTYTNSLWLAVGYGIDLTEKHLQILQGRKVMLFPDDMAVNHWSNMAEKYTNIHTAQVFAEQNADIYLINAVKQRKP